MKRHAFVIPSLAVIGGFLVCSVAAAEPYDARLRARAFRTNLVQAADECTTPTTVIGGVGACGAANVATAPDARFTVGRLLVRSSPIRDQVVVFLRSRGNLEDPKDLAGKNLVVRLTLRVTRRSNPGDAATWVDQVVTCGVGQGPVPENGAYFYSGDLVGAPPNCGLAITLGNLAFEKEVIDAAVIDSDTGLPVAVPGIRRKP